MRENSTPYSHRILQIGKYSLSSNGGIETVTRLIHCNSQGLEVESLTFKIENIEALPNEESVLPLITFSKQPIALKYVFQIRKILQRHRTVLLHLPNIFSALLLYVLAPKARIVVFWHADILRSAWYLPVVRMLEKKICERAESIIYTSQSYYDSSYSKYWVGKDKAHVISLGVPAPLHYKKKYKAKNDVLKILFIGRNTAYKGLGDLLEAVRENCNVRLTIVGVEFSEVASIVGNAPNVDVAGALSVGQKQRVIADHDFLVLPSTSKAEAFGLVLIEALSAGTPVITRYVAGSGMNEVSAPFRGRPVGYSFGGSPGDTLSAALTAAYNLDRSDYKIMSDTAREKYIKNYTATAFTSAVVRHFSDEV